MLNRKLERAGEGEGRGRGGGQRERERGGGREEVHSGLLNRKFVRGIEKEIGNLRHAPRYLRGVHC